MANVGSLNRMFLDSDDRVPQKSLLVIKILFTVALVFVLMVSFCAPSFADSAQMDSSQMENAAIAPESSATVEAGEDIAAEKIDQFAQAYLQVLQLMSDREAEIPAAETNAEALKIEKSIETDAIAIIQDNGLTLPEYMQILGIASQDTTFQDQVLGKMDDAQEES